MQWFGIGVTLAGHVRPRRHGAAPAGGVARPAGRRRRRGTVLVPLGLLASEIRAPGAPRQPVAGAGAGGARVRRRRLGHLPGGGARPRARRRTTTADKEVLGLSLLAAGDRRADLCPVPAEVRLQSATRFVYGARQAPDEVLRTFGSRLTRAIPMDELLLQLAESLRKTMALTSAEVYTGTGEVLERTVSVPDVGPLSIVVSPSGTPGCHTGRGVGHGLGVRLAAGAVGRARAGADPRRPGQPRRRTARTRRRRAIVGGERILRGGRPCPHGPGPPGRARACTTPSSTPPCRRRWTRSASRRTRCASPGRASSPAATPNAAASSGTCMTARSSISSRWRSTCA